MPKSTRPAIFLSYSRHDQNTAAALQKALEQRKLPVWRDTRNIAAGLSWAQEIEKGIRASRAAVVLITPDSTNSAWVTYEYAFATGAGVPVVAVRADNARVPSPIRQFQIVKFTDAKSVAKMIDEGLSAQSRVVGQKRAYAPTLLAKFVEVNGEPAKASGGKTPSLSLESWLENVPPQTQRVTFEIPDEGFRDSKWSVKRSRRADLMQREFLTDEDFNSWGDIEIWARGTGRGTGNWSASWRLYEALVRYYDKRSPGPSIRRALKQIRDN
jgi:TIR domain-containing protein